MPMPKNWLERIQIIPFFSFLNPSQEGEFWALMEVSRIYELKEGIFRRPRTTNFYRTVNTNLSPIKVFTSPQILRTVPYWQMEQGRRKGGRVQPLLVSEAQGDVCCTLPSYLFNNSVGKIGLREWWFKSPSINHWIKLALKWKGTWINPDRKISSKKTLQHMSLFAICI